MWKVRRAVRPSSRLMFSGFFSPGTWTRIRSAPWRWIEASRVPSSSIRRRTTSSDWLIAAWRSSKSLASVSRSTIRPASSVTSKSRIRPEAPTVIGLSLSISASAWSRCAGSVSVSVTASPWTPSPR